MSLRQSLEIMVVDDMSVSRALITNALDEMGIVKYRVENNGLSALEKLSVRPCHLVISDYNMPKMDGLGLLKALRENKTTARIGFILITGNATNEVITTGQRFGMNNMIRKPFSTPQLKQCIEKVVGRL